MTKPFRIYWQPFSYSHFPKGHITKYRAAWGWVERGIYLMQGFPTPKERDEWITHQSKIIKQCKDMDEYLTLYQSIHSLLA